VAATPSSRHKGWITLAVACSMLALVALVSAMSALFGGEPFRALWLAVALQFWYWIGLGAWRRAERQTAEHRAAGLR
jgi:hypothetical protein